MSKQGMRSKISILFVVPGYSLGGTTSSLVSLLSSDFIKNYDIDVYAISKRDYCPSVLVPYDIGLNELTTIYYSDFSSLKAVDRIKYLYVKLLKRIPSIARLTEQWIVNKTIRTIERKKHYDFVVAFQEGNATRFTSHFACKKKVAWIHCDYAKSYGDTIDELDLYNLFSTIVCVSEFTRKGFIGRYPSLEEKTVAIHNIFDAKGVIEKSGEAIDDDRFDNSLFTIMSLGRVCDVKRFYLIPQIAAKVKESNPRFRWFIVGGGTSADMKRVTEAIAGFGVENEVICLGGKANPYPYLNASNLLVSVSKSEACPMVFNEAKLLHIPILSADFGSAFEFIIQGENGFITSIEEMPKVMLDMINGTIKPNQPQSSSYIQDSNDESLSRLKFLFS